MLSSYTFFYSCSLTSFPRPPRTSVASALVRREMARAASLSATRTARCTESFPSSCVRYGLSRVPFIHRVETSPMATVLVVSPSTAADSMMRISRFVTLVPVSCLWPMLVPTQTALRYVVSPRGDLSVVLHHHRSLPLVRWSSRRFRSSQERYGSAGHP